MSMLNEWIANIPDETDAAHLDPESLVARSVSGRRPAQRLPLGVIPRVGSLTAMHARIALGYLGWWCRSRFQGSEEAARSLNETHLKAALKLLDGLGYLRGLMAKVGQTLAAYPQLTSDEFANVLEKLCFEAPPMHEALIREQIRAELGKEPDELFASFDHVPIAAASMGQVHKAQLRNGATVAVKVQYPGIGRTIRSDFRTLAMLFAPMRFKKEWQAIRRQIEDARNMIELETDYIREADLLEKGRALLEELEGVVVPIPFRAYCTKRVLTMSWIDGDHIDAFLRRNPDQDSRNRSATLMYQASFRMAYRGRLIHADANPGNYVFTRDGRLGLLDFGCCRNLDDEDWSVYTDCLNGYREGGEKWHSAIRRAAAYDASEDVDPAIMNQLIRHSDWIMEYMGQEGPFDFGNTENIDQGIEILRDNSRKGIIKAHPMNTWLLRHVLGARILAWRLNAKIPVKAIHDEEERL